MDYITLVIRLSLVFFLTLIYGVQRQKSHKPVGFGTYILVAIGACGLSIASQELVGINNTVSLLAAIITGIGFLGAGALIKTPDKVFGFTTAASIWFFAIFGVLIGIGEYLIGIILYFLAFVIVLFDESLEKRGIGSYRRKIIITSNKIVGKKELAEIMAGYCTHFNLLYININKKDKKMVYAYLIEGPRKDISHLIKEIYNKKWCTSVFFE